MGIEFGKYCESLTQNRAIKELDETNSLLDFRIKSNTGLFILLLFIHL